MSDDTPTDSPGTSPTPTVPVDDRSDPPPPGRGWGRRAIALVVVVALVGGLGFLIGRIAAPDDDQPPSRAATPPTPSSTPTGSAIPSDPSASGLAQLGLREQDVDPAVNVLLIPDGNRVTGHPTLDLCNGTYRSEALRRARLQVVESDARGNTTISTESVLYASSAATEQAFTELRTIAAHCPAKPVVSPVGEPTATTKFNAAPDRSWGDVPTVTRLAFDFVSTDASGGKSHAIAVYLRRGRAFTAVYFPQVDSLPTAVQGHSSIASITNLFAKRLAALPRSVAGD